MEKIRGNRAEGPERYLADHNARVVALLTRPGKTETERFWDAMEEMGEGGDGAEAMFGRIFALEHAEIHGENDRGWDANQSGHGSF